MNKVPNTLKSKKYLIQFMVHIMQAVDTAQKLPVMLVLLNSQMVSLLCARSN